MVLGKAKVKVWLTTDLEHGSVFNFNYTCYIFETCNQKQVIIYTYNLVLNTTQ